MTVTAMLHRQRYRVIELDRDIYKGGCSEVTVTSGPHAQKDKERQQRHPVGAQCKERIRLMMMMLRGGHQEVRGVTVSRAGERVPPYTVNELP